jgi:hypothetical protein
LKGKKMEYLWKLGDLKKSKVCEWIRDVGYKSS